MSPPLWHNQVLDASFPLKEAALCFAPPTLYLCLVLGLCSLRATAVRAIIALLVAGAFGSTALVLGLGGLTGSSSASEARDLLLLGPLLEELAKGIALVFVLRWADRGSRQESVLFGLSVGLGFATTENLVWLWAVESTSSVTDLQLVGVRVLLPSVMHGTTSAMLCLSLVGSRSLPGLRRALYLSLGFALVVVLHGLWNGIALGAIGDTVSAERDAEVVAAERSQSA